MTGNALARASIAARMTDPTCAKRASDDKKLLVYAALIYASPFLLSWLCVITYFVVNIVVGLIALAVAVVVRLHGG